MIEMNQTEATKLFHRTEALQSHLMDVMNQLLDAEAQFTEMEVLPDDTTKIPDIETLTVLDNSARTQVSTTIQNLGVIIRSELAFLQQIKAQCAGMHGAILPETARPM